MWSFLLVDDEWSHQKLMQIGAAYPYNTMLESLSNKARAKAGSMSMDPERRLSILTAPFDFD